MKINSDHWETLANYESTDLVKRQFQGRHGRELNTGKAQEICAAFTQARGYMEAAKSADRIVRPLLVYYGILSLSRGVTLFLSTTLREAGLAQAHGLSVQNWNDELSRSNDGIAPLRIKLNAKGTFRQLVQATGHRSYLRNNSSRANYTVTCEMPPAGAEVALGDVMSRLPEIRTTYRRWRDDRCTVRIWPQQRRSDGRMEVRVDPPDTMEDVQAVFGDEWPLVDQSGGVITILAPLEATIPILSDVNERWNIGSLVAMTLMPGRLELSKISLAFVMSYALGMIVRYYPSHWIAMLHNQLNDGAVPSLLAALKHVEEDFPRFVVEFLEPPEGL